MRKEVIGTGKNVQEALDNAARLLGREIGDDGVEQEILEMGRKGGLFRKAVEAKVRMWYDEPDVPVRPQRTRAPRPAQERAPRTERYDRPERAERAEKTDRIERTERPSAPRPPRPADKPRPAPQKPVERAEADTAEPDEEKSTYNQAKAEAAKQFIEDILRVMEIQGTVEIKPVDDGVVLSLCGEDIGAIIGRRGGTLDALQYLTKLVANRAEGSYCRITLDCENYREKREKTLEALARKMASNVQKSGRAMTLEPMNPYERRIIHATIQRIPGVTSSSIGDEPSRRVVIQPEGGEYAAPRRDYAPRGDRPRQDRGSRRPRPERYDRADRPEREAAAGREDSAERTEHPARSDRYDRRDRGDRPPRERRESQTIATKPDPNRPIKEEMPEAPLYGRIDIE